MGFMKTIRNRLIQGMSDLTRFIQYGDLPTWYYVKKGMKVGERFDRQSGTRLDISNCWLIEIGNNVVLANRVQLLAHDDSAEQLCGYRKIGKIIIGNDVFIGANSLVLPGVTIGDDCVIGAGSVVTKSVPANSVAVGVPAKVVGTTAEYRKKIQEDIELARKDGRMLDIQYDIHCRPDRDITQFQLDADKRYYFKIARFCDEQ